MPTSDYEDEEVEELYDGVEDILEEDGKGDRSTIIMEIGTVLSALMDWMPQTKPSYNTLRANAKKLRNCKEQDGMI
jgi:hypothetical protein